MISNQPLEHERYRPASGPSGSDGKEDASAVEDVALLQRLGLTSSSIVIDVGAGTGQFTLAVAPVSEHLVAVDVSPVMLELLRVKVGRMGLGNVEVVQAGFLTYDHAGRAGRYRLLPVRALHHLPDVWKAVALTRLRSVLRPGDVLRLWDVVYDFAPEEAEARIEAWCAKAGDGIVGEWSRAELEEHVRDEHSTFTWLLEPMIRRAGFDIDEALYSHDGVFARYVLRAV